MSRKALGRGLSALFNQPATAEQELLELPIDQIEQAPDQPRKLFRDEKLEELAQSIRANGVIQPLVVRRQGDKFQIIAGERRWRAAQKAGLLRLPCVIKEVPDDRVLEMSLIENIQREELNPIEEATAYKKLLEQLRITQEEIARRVGRDRSSIANSMRLLKLPSDIQRLVEEEKLAMGHARALLALASVEQQRVAAKRVVGEGLSVRAAEQLVQKLINGPAQTQKKAAPDKDRANIAAAETKLSRKLGAPVSIKLAGKGGSIQIRFSSSNELSRLYDVLLRQAKAGDL